MVMNNFGVIMKINSKNIIDLSLKEKEIKINGLERLWIIIIYKTVTFFIINQPFWKLNIILLTDISCN